MATAAALRALLGNDVRFFIDVPIRTDSWLVGARWSCGCYAEGRGFTVLRVRPCRRHAKIIPESMTH